MYAKKLQELADRLIAKQKELDQYHELMRSQEDPEDSWKMFAQRDKLLHDINAIQTEITLLHSEEEDRIENSRSTGQRLNMFNVKI